MNTGVVNHAVILGRFIGKIPKIETPMDKGGKMTEVEKAYIAGIIDGEGCIHITKKPASKITTGHWSYQVGIYIGNTDKRMLEFVHRLCGGGLKAHKTPEGCKQCYELYFTGDRVQELLKDILPYLITKKEQAKNVLALPNYRRRVWRRDENGKAIRGRTEEEEREQEGIWARNKYLNRTGD